MNDLQTFSRALVRLYAARQTMNLTMFSAQLLPILHTVLGFERGLIGLGGKLISSHPDLVPVLSTNKGTPLILSRSMDTVKNLDDDGLAYTFNGNTNLRNETGIPPILKDIAASFAGRRPDSADQSMICVHRTGLSRGDAWMALSRSRDHPFTTEEAAMVFATWPHLLSNYLYCVEKSFDLVQEMFSTRSLALITPNGNIMAGDQRFVQLVAAEWPHCPPKALPKEVVPALRENRVYVGEHITIGVKTSDQDSDRYLKCEASVSAIPSHLNALEKAIVHYISVGLDYRQVAAQMGLSPHTIRTHIAKIYKKLAINNKAELTRLCLPSAYMCQVTTK